MEQKDLFIKIVAYAEFFLEESINTMKSEEFKKERLDLLKEIDDNFDDMLSKFK